MPERRIHAEHRERLRYSMMKNMTCVVVNNV